LDFVGLVVFWVVRGLQVVFVGLACWCGLCFVGWFVFSWCCVGNMQVVGLLFDGVL
jgi:hypothetical protein